MASHAAPAVCSTAAYQNFLPLAAFPPAQGWCSTVSLLPRRSEQDSANALAPHDVQCPVGSNLCALLADLKAADREFARGVCCCIGVCVGDEPTAIITIPDATTPTPTSTSGPLTSQVSSSMTYIQRHSSDSLLPASTSSSSSWTMTYIQRHSIDSLMTYIQRHSSDTLEPMPSPDLSSSTSSILLPTSSSTSVPSSTCTSVAFGSRTFTQYYSGTGHVENTNNPGNNNPVYYPPKYRTLPGTLAMCDAASACAATSSNYPAPYDSFDLHAVTSNSTWECVSYPSQNSGGNAAGYFNVPNADVGAAYGYSLL